MDRKIAEQIVALVNGTIDRGAFEVQATAEGAPFTRELLDELLELAAGGIAEIARAQEDAFA